MGALSGQYNAEFPTGTSMIVATREALEEFRATWKFHNPLREEQLVFADAKARVASVGYYHGGDELYELEGIPGTWHACCLRVAE